MTETAIAPAQAPAAAPAPVAPTPPAPAAAPAAPESLIHNAAPASAPAAAPAAPADPFVALVAQLPEKFHVKAGDVVDPAASLAKALEHRDHLERRLGAGDLPPKTPAEYGFEVPQELQGFELKNDRIEAFKTEAHEKGITGEQFKWMMGAYLKAVPDLMEGAAKLSADQARAELGKTWTTPDAMSRGIEDASRALRALPNDLQQETAEYGTSPAFLRAMAHLGAQMREDRPPSSAPPSGQVDVTSLEASKAYRDPRDPDHARVSKLVADHYKRVAGDSPI
jgi:hypothetical protein